MEISLSTYKKIYKKYLEEHNLKDDSHSVSGEQAKNFIVYHLGWDDDVISEFCSEHGINLNQNDDNDDEVKELLPFEIYFDDLNEDAQNRFRDAGLWHENIDMTPLAIFECEPDFEEI